MSPRSLWLLALAMTTACGEDVRAQIVITVDAQQLVQSETATLEAVARGGPSTTEIDEMPAFEETKMRPLEWPRTFAFAPEGGDASRALLFSAVARDVSGRVVGETRILRGYAAGRVLRIRLVLTDVCRGVECPQVPEPMRCENGACILATEDPDLPDAGTGDAGPPVPCAADEECDDGIFCNGVETCVGGVCARGALPSCDDAIGCTEDRCSGEACDHVPADAQCTARGGGHCDPELDCQYDGCDPSTCLPTVGCQTATCTPDGACVRTSTCGPAEMCCAGTCVPRDCDDGRVCTRDLCAVSGCVHEPISGPCDDANLCTSGDTCAGGACTAGPPLPCDDGNACTDDTCSAGTCVHTAADGRVCDDGRFCTDPDRCSGPTCAGTPRSCVADLNPCTEEVCVEASRACESRPLMVFSSCDDGDLCTEDDRCDSGFCVGGRMTTCPDSWSCCPGIGCNASGCF